MDVYKNDILEFLRSLKSELHKKGISKIALFGSFAEGNTTIYSDIDIAIKKEQNYLKNRNPYEYFETLNSIKEKILSKFGRNVDIFDLDSKSDFKEDIEKELIYV